MDRIKVGGIMQSDGRALLRVLSVPPLPGASASLLGAVGGAGINLELIVTSLDMDQMANFALVVAGKDLEHALGVIEEIQDELGAAGLAYTPDVAIISVFGPHLREKPVIPGTMMAALASMGVSALALATSISSVSCVVEGAHLNTALAALTEVFDAPFQVKKRPKDY